MGAKNSCDLDSTVLLFHCDAAKEGEYVDMDDRNAIGKKKGSSNCSLSIVLSFFTAQRINYETETDLVNSITDVVNYIHHWVWLS